MAASTHAPHELYIYYRADAAHATALAAAVRGMQQALCAAHPGLRARLLRRPETHAGQHTWMEAYVLPGPAAGDDSAAASSRLCAAIEQAAVVALQPWLAGPRHVERFIACAW